MNSNQSRTLSRFSKAMIAGLFALAALQAHAQQYRWLDEKGRVQYTDTPPPPTAKGVQKKNFDAAKGDGPVEPFALQRARKEAPVKLYTGPNCPDCDNARNHLNKRGVPFTEVSVTTDETLAELRAISGRANVPVMLVGSQMQRGFGEYAYDNDLDLAGYPKKGILPARNQVAPVVKNADAKSTAKPAAGAAGNAPAK